MVCPVDACSVESVKSSEKDSENNPEINALIQLNALIRSINDTQSKPSPKVETLPAPTKNDLNLHSPDTNVMNLIEDIEKFLAWAKHHLPKNVGIAFEQIKERLDKIKQEFDKLTPDEKQEFLNYGKSDPKISQFTKSFL